MDSSSSVVDQKVWEDLQGKIDDDNIVKDQLRDVTQILEKDVKKATSVLSNAQASTQRQSIMAEYQASYLTPLVRTVESLANIASAHPYYKYNNIWTRLIQDSVFVIIFFGWCGGFNKEQGQLLTIEEVGTILNEAVPVNVKDRDTFHLTIEEYLHACISLVDELARVARNSVTQGDFARPVLISQFIKDLHAGFQLLNLKNDSLRKRNDGIKYRLREVEDVIYDLSLRNLLPKPSAATA